MAEYRRGSIDRIIAPRFHAVDRPEHPQRIVPHSCKSPACASCGKVRTDAWCSQLLSDILDVAYRLLGFTIPWQLRLIIRDNRRLSNVMFREAADAVLSLTAGHPKPMGRKVRKRVEGRRGRKPFCPGIVGRTIPQDT
jgi:hypothetical protein